MTRHNNPYFKAYNEACRKREEAHKIAKKLYVEIYVNALEDAFSCSTNWVVNTSTDDNMLAYSINSKDIEIFILFEESENSKPVFIKTSIRGQSFVFSENKKLNLDWNTTEEFIDCIYNLIGRCYVISR